MNGNRELKEVFEKMHFGRDKLPKTLKVSMTLPAMDENYDSIKEGTVIMAVLSKGNSAGFALNTGELGDMIYALEHVRQEILDETYRLTRARK